MAHPSPALVELARRLVDHEAGTAPAAAAAAAAVAVDRICLHLREDLKDILGSGGVSALLGRALTLARRDHPLLAGAAVANEPAACFTGLAGALAQGSDEEAATAGTFLVAHLLGLLASLLGEDLAIQPARRLWPDVSFNAMEIEE
jgi:hypothetical protein